MDRVPGNEMKDERAQDRNAPGVEPGTQWSSAYRLTKRTAFHLHLNNVGLPSGQVLMIKGSICD